MFVVVTFFADVSITLYSNYVLKLSYKKVILVAFVSSQKMTKNDVIITSFVSWIVACRLQLIS